MIVGISGWDGGANFAEGHALDAHMASVSQQNDRQDAVRGPSRKTVGGFRDGCRHESCFVLRPVTSLGFACLRRDLRMMPMAERPHATHKTFAFLTAVRVIAGVAVFALGVVAGAVFAAWLMPPF